MKNDGSTFQERLARAAEAKQKALDKLRAKPPVDPAVLAERQAVAVKREAALAEKRAASAAARQEAKDAKAAKAVEAAEAVCSADGIEQFEVVVGHFADRVEADPRRQVRADQGTRRLRQQDLAAVSDGEDKHLMLFGHDVVSYFTEKTHRAGNPAIKILHKAGNLAKADKVGVLALNSCSATPALPARPSPPAPRPSSRFHSHAHPRPRRSAGARRGRRLLRREHARAGVAEVRGVRSIHADTPIPAANTSASTMLNLSLRPMVASPFTRLYAGETGAPFSICCARRSLKRPRPHPV